MEYGLVLVKAMFSVFKFYVSQNLKDVLHYSFVTAMFQVNNFQRQLFFYTTALFFKFMF